MGAIAALAFLVALLSACSGGEDLGGDKLEPDPAVILPVSARAMGEVTSVRFELVHDGADVHIDPLDALAVDEVIGRFAAPASADAVITVRVNGTLATQLGAVAIDDTAWLSNPVTGTFEPLPESYGIEPSLFFDPKGGWQPMLETLADAVMVGEESRDGTRYHIRARATADAIEKVTAGLVDGQEVDIDLWLHPVSGLVTAAEFSVDVEGGVADWTLNLSRYGDDVTIEPPEVG